MPIPTDPPPNWPPNRPWPPVAGAGGGDIGPGQLSVPTPPAIQVAREWVDVYAESGIAVGTQILINTRGKHSVYLAESAAAPGDFEGIELYPTRQAIVDAGSVGLWARTAHNNPYSLIIVQVDTTA